MKKLSTFFAVLLLALAHAAKAADVMPVWQNDTTANTLSFSDTFGHQVQLGTYSAGTGAWMPSGAQSIIVGTSVITGTCPSGEVLTNAAGVVGCAAAGSGTVTSVALTLPSFLTVSGSPITTSGTLAVTATSEPANEVLASPDGAPGAMAPRTLVAGDISGIPGNLVDGSSPVSGGCTNGYVLYNNAGTLGCTAGGGSGTVTSVGMTVPAWLTVSGSPVVSAGTLALTATSEPQNLFLASPNGSTGAMVPRSITGNDLTSALASPPSIGNTTAGTGAFTTLSASGAVSGVGFSNYLASPPAIGSTVANTGAFTTLSASGAVSGAGFSTYLASPPPIGSGTANTGGFTTLSVSGTVSGAGFTSLFASPPSIGSTAPGTGAFTTLSGGSGALAVNVTGTLTQTPTTAFASGVVPGIKQSYAATGSAGTAISASINQLYLSSDNLTVSGSPSNASLDLLAVYDLSFGGSAATGGRIAGDFNITQTAATSASSAFRDYVGMHGTCNSISGDGGGSGTEKGSCFGAWSSAQLGASATHMTALQSMEMDITALSGSSVLYKIGLELDHVASDAVQGSVVDADLLIINDAGSIGSNVGIQFGSSVSGGYGVTSTGTLIALKEGVNTTIGAGIDLTDGGHATITGNAWASPGAVITGAGIFSSNNSAGDGYIAQGTRSEAGFKDASVSPYGILLNGTYATTPIYASGIIQTTGFAANGSVATVLGSLGPAGSHTTVQEWFEVKDSGGTVRYVAGF